MDEARRLPGLPADEGPRLPAEPTTPRRWTAIAGDKPFILHPDGRGWLYVPTGLVDGPLPVHYEPHESPFANALYAQQHNPTRQVFPRPENAYNPSSGEAGSAVFPFVLSTYRLTEHHTAGGMSRTIEYLAELQPEFFCEVSPAARGRARARARRLGDIDHRAQRR